MGNEGPLALEQQLRLFLDDLEPTGIEDAELCANVLLAHRGARFSARLHERRQRSCGFLRRGPRAQTPCGARLGGALLRATGVDPAALQVLVHRRLEDRDLAVARGVAGLDR